MKLLAPILLAPLFLLPILIPYLRAKNFFQKNSNANEWQHWNKLRQLLEKSLLRVPKQVLFVLTLITMVILSSVFLHRTNNYLDTVPIATDDDTISNVSINLWKNHKYGFPNSPTMIHYGVTGEPVLKEKHFDGTHHYYNYGWFYFVATGFLNWMVGDDSMAFFRMMNPWGLLFIIGLGTWLFWRISPLPGSLLAIGLISRFLLSVSPVMARPDIAVPVAASLFFVSAFFAFEKATFICWFLTGFWAATAATSHLVAWTLVLAAGLTWVFFSLSHSNSKKTVLKSFYGIMLGGILGVLLFLAIMGFRIGDLWSFVSFLNQNVKHPPFWSNFIFQVRSIWISSGFTFVLGWTGQIIALALLACSFLISKEDRIRVLALLAAPSLSAILYILSLGHYRGVVQPTYGMLAYVSTMWTMAAAVAVLIGLLSSFIKKDSFKAVSWLSSALAFLLLVVSVSASIRNTPNLEKLKPGWVKYSDYERRILDNLPQNAYTWGNINFGFNSGVRTDFIDSNAALALALHFNKEGWSKIAPDYLAFGYYTLERYLRAGPLVGKDSPIAIFRRKLPDDTRFELTHIAYAPPYGNSFIYRKVHTNGAEKTTPITLSVNDGTNPQWHTAIAPESKPNTTPATPVTVDLSNFGKQTFNAQASVRMMLERGFYLVRARVPSTQPEQTAAVLASPGSYVYADDDSRLQHAPFFRGQIETSFVVDHLGGPLYLSYFPGRSHKRSHRLDDFKITGVARIPELIVGSSLKSMKLPTFDQWHAGPSYKTQISDSGVITIDGATSVENPDPVFTSPLIKLKARSAYTLILPIEAKAGALRISVLNQNGDSLLYGDSRPLSTRVGFYTGEDGSVILQVHHVKTSAQTLHINLFPATLIPHDSKMNHINQLLSCPTTGKWSNGSEGLCINVDDHELHLLDADLMPLDQ